jgi:selenocysteine lyase/cysteine desulfurase
LPACPANPGAGGWPSPFPAVSAHGSKLADLAELSALARQHGAILVVDVSHDLGAMGAAGGGVMEIQACHGRIDILLGSLAKTFGAAGGFAAFRDPGLKAALHPSPWQTTRCRRSTPPRSSPRSTSSQGPRASAAAAICTGCRCACAIT